MKLEEIQRLRAMTEQAVADGFEHDEYRRDMTPSKVLQLLAIAEAHSAECQDCDGLGDRIVLRKDGADLSDCGTCGGTGQQCVGFSGSPDDGNGPVLELCGECGYGSDLPDRIHFTEAWKRRYQYSPSYRFLDDQGNFCTPADDPVHAGWAGWQLARAAELPVLVPPEPLNWEAGWWHRDHIILSLEDDPSFMRKVDLLIKEPHLPELRKSAIVTSLNEIVMPAIRRFYVLGRNDAFTEAKLNPPVPA